MKKICAPLLFAAALSSPIAWGGKNAICLTLQIKKYSETVEPGSALVAKPVIDRIRASVIQAIDQSPAMQSLQPYLEKNVDKRAILATVTNNIVLR